MKKIAFLLLALPILFIVACQEETFMKDSAPIYSAPTDLEYMNVLEAREGKRIITFAPTVNTGGLIPSFEILKGADAEGNELDTTYMNDVSIANPSEGYTILEDDNGDSIGYTPLIDYKDAGVITFIEGNDFNHGQYYFDIKVSTEAEGKVFESSFEKAFKLSVGPELAEVINYTPRTQNLLTDGSNQTTAPFMPSGNEDVRYELGNYTDILEINSETGIIKIKPGATPQEGTIYPKVNVISNISNEVTSFEGAGFLTMIISVEPVHIEPQTFTIFYPSLESENTLYGYRKFVTIPGAVTDAKTWIQETACNLAAPDRPDNIGNPKSLMTNIVISKKSIPHESWVVMNSQSLYNYSQGFDLTATFWMKNRYVEYLTDGRTPTNLEVYVSTDFASSVEKATWTQVNDVLNCEIHTNTEIIPVTGTPYPGDQKGDNPDGLKDPSANADDKWVKCVLDLTPYKEAKNFTFAFKFASYFEGEITGATGRGGRYYISDVHYQAAEIPQN